MSFILDALKKSELERQRQNAPGIADVPRATDAHSVPRWIWILGSLLLVNTIVLIGLVLRPGLLTSTEDVVVRQQLAPVAEEIGQQDTSSFSNLVAEAKRNQTATNETTAAEQDTGHAGTTSAAQENIRTENSGSAATSSQLMPRGTRSNSIVRDGLRSFDDLRVAGVLQLPDLHLDIHVFAQQPANRFVFINMNKYKEGAFLTEGPLVKEITPEGVVLENSGVNFLLPRE